MFLLSLKESVTACAGWCTVF